MVKQGAQLLGRYLRPQWAGVALLAVLLALNIALQLLNPQALRHFIDAARAGASLEALRNTALLFMGIVALGQVAVAGVKYTAEQVAWTATNALRADLALHCLRLPLSFHNARTPGELIARADGDVGALSNFFSEFVLRVLGNSLLLAGALAIAWWEDWRIGLLLTLFSAVALATLGRLRRVAVPAFKQQRQAFAEMTGFWEERLAGTEDLRASGALPYTMRRNYQALDAYNRSTLRSRLMGRVLQSAGEMLLALGMAGAFAVGAYVLSQGATTIGTLYLIFAYTNLIAWNLLEITFQLEDLQAAMAAIERIQEMLHTPNPLETEAATALPPGPPVVEFQDVTFGYAAELPVLHGISFRLEPGRTLGLLGRTGSGKTTLGRLLFRFYDPDEGELRWNGVDIRTAPVAELRRSIGIVTQEVQLFGGTLRDNLTLFDRNIPDERIMEALRDLELEDWLLRLPAGLDTQLGGGAGGFSAGQAQLLAFARVFLRNPQLVILDEASSRLDPATERLVGRAMERLLRPEGGGRSAIIIAHRLQTVRRVDEIMILEDGRILEHGRRAELERDPTSHFARLLETGLEEALA